MAKAKYKYTLTGTINYEDREVDIPMCRYLNEKELCDEVADTLRYNITKATSYTLIIVPHKSHKNTAIRP